MYWAPLETKRRDICILPQPENDSKQMVNDDWSLKSGNSIESWSGQGVISLLAAISGGNSSYHIANIFYK
jgi:hypothetical protein